MKKTRLMRICEVCQVLTFCTSENEDGMTSYQLAYWVGLKPSSHFNRILKTATDVGYISYSLHPHRPGVMKKKYKVTERGRVLAKTHEQVNMFARWQPHERPLVISEVCDDIIWF